MGFFLGGSAVHEADSKKVVEIVQEFLPHQTDFGPVEIEQLSIGVSARNITVLYPPEFFDWEEVSIHLSKVLATTVLSLHIHDGDLWTFVLYKNGSRITAFNPWPNYWGTISESDLKKWQPDIQKIASAFNLEDSTAFERYLVRWDDEILRSPKPKKAYSNDNVPIGNCWQLVDFLASIGFSFPEIPEPSHDELLVQDVDPGPNFGRIRTQADAAWKSKDYGRAKDLYTQIGDQLKPSEIKKIEYCSKQLELKNENKPWWRFW